jgi:hypothetical protein
LNDYFEGDSLSKTQKNVEDMVKDLLSSGEFHVSLLIGKDRNNVAIENIVKGLMKVFKEAPANEIGMFQSLYIKSLQSSFDERLKAHDLETQERMKELTDELIETRNGCTERGKEIFKLNCNIRQLKLKLKRYDDMIGDFLND